jgi:hypothetical protein
MKLEQLYLYLGSYHLTNCLPAFVIVISTESLGVIWFPSTDPYVLFDWIAVKELLCSS